MKSLGITSLFLIFSFHSGYSQKSTETKALLLNAEQAYINQKFDRAKEVFERATYEYDGKIDSEDFLLLGNIQFALKDFENARVSYFNFLKNLEVGDKRRDAAQISITRATQRMKIANQEIQDKADPKPKEKRTVAKPQIPQDYTIKERVPIYPGCEKFESNEQLKSCMTSAINQSIRSHFQKGLISSIGFGGSILIETKFTIDGNGKFTNIGASSLHPFLEIEAIRVISQLPQVQPAIQRDLPVSIQYGLPIILEN